MKSRVLSALARRTPEPPVSWLMAMTLNNPQLISLAAGFTDHATLPVRESRQLLNRLLANRRSGRAALQYGTTEGDPVLRRLTAERLLRLDRESLAAHGARPPRPAWYAPERLVITSGSQQLLYVVSECLCEPDDIVLVEDPTYFVYLGIVRSHGLKCRGVRMEPDGLDLRRLEHHLEVLRRTGQLRRLKLLYLVSYFQNPTGITTAYSKKRAALALLRRYEAAAGHPIFLVEDAAYRELRFSGEDVPSALTLPAALDRVVYGGTFSKPFATGARVGYGILPEALRDGVLRVKGNHDFGTSNLLQQLLRAALASGKYERHLVRLRQRYATKARAMTEAMRRHFPSGVEWREPHGGLYVWARLPRTTRTGPGSELFRRALQHDVLYVPGEFCYAEDPTRRRPAHEMRLSFGGASMEHLRRGIARLGGALGETRRHRAALLG